MTVRIAAMRLAIILTMPAVSALAHAPVQASQPVSLRAIERAPYFPCVASLLQRIVDAEHVVEPQRLSLASSAGADGSTVVRVYWPQARAILLIDPAMACDRDSEDGRNDNAQHDNAQHDDEQDLDWYGTKARIDLDTDVVATADDIAGSTYLVDRPWVDAVIAACLNGHGLVVVPSVGH
jgi:hypothetical protein